LEFNFQNKKKVKIRKNKFKFFKKKSDFFFRIFLNYGKYFIFKNLDANSLKNLETIQIFFPKILFQNFIKSFLKLKF